MNIFDIMGPIMVGPSSSHTAGAGPVGRKRPTDSSEMIGMLGGNEFRLRRGFAFGKTLVRAEGAGAHTRPTTAQQQHRSRKGTLSSYEYL